MFYELARHPQIVARLLAEQDAQITDGRVGGFPSPAQLMSGELSELEMVFDETLRKYPPAWIGPRRSVEPFEFAGHSIPAAPLSTTAHGLPQPTRRLPEPSEFRPERFTEEAKAALPRRLRPFGGGSRTCIGMRFGQLEIRTIATLLLARFTLSLSPTSTWRSARCRRSARRKAYP